MTFTWVLFSRFDQRLWTHIVRLPAPGASSPSVQHHEGDQSAAGPAAGHTLRPTGPELVRHWTLVKWLACWLIGYLISDWIKDLFTDWAHAPLLSCKDTPQVKLLWPCLNFCFCKSSWVQHKVIQPWWSFQSCFGWRHKLVLWSLTTHSRLKVKHFKLVLSCI